LQLQELMTSQNRSNRHAMRTSYGAHRMATHTIATLTLPQPPSVMTCICRQSPTLCPVVYNGTEIQLRCRRCRAITLAKEHGKKVSNHHAHSLGCPRGVPSFAGKTHADKYRADAAKKPKKPSSLAVLKKDSARHAAVMGETQAAAQARLFGHPAAARALPPRPPLPAAVAAASSSSSSAARSSAVATSMCSKGRRVPAMHAVASEARRCHEHHRQRLLRRALLRTRLMCCCDVPLRIILRCLNRARLSNCQHLCERPNSVPPKILRAHSTCSSMQCSATLRRGCAGRVGQLQLCRWPCHQQARRQWYQRSWLALQHQLHRAHLR